MNCFSFLSFFAVNAEIDDQYSTTGCVVASSSIDILVYLYKYIYLFYCISFVPFGAQRTHYTTHAISTLSRANVIALGVPPETILKPMCESAGHDFPSNRKIIALHDESVRLVASMGCRAVYSSRRIQREERKEKRKKNGKRKYSLDDNYVGVEAQETHYGSG